MDWKQLTADFKAKYEGCYCFVTLEKQTTKKLFRLHGVEQGPKGGAPMLYLNNEEDGHVILKYDDSASDVEFTFPEIGLFEYNGKVYMVRRRHERQWKAGVCVNTIGVNDIAADLAKGDLLFSPTLSSALVQAMYQSRPTKSMAEAVAALRTAVATTLSSEFALTRSPTLEKQFILFFYEQPIGTVSLDGQEVVLKEGQFSQEYQDFISSLRKFGNYANYR